MTTSIVSSASVVPEAPAHCKSIEALLDEAFGPGRFARTAYRLREGAQPSPGLSFVALMGGTVIGAVRFFPITIGAVPALLLGPLVIGPAHKNRGHGLKLMRTGLDAARAAGHRLVILVGDAPYYARTGFAVAPRDRIHLPGPVDPQRLLYLELVPGALAGVEGPARPVPASAPDP